MASVKDMRIWGFLLLCKSHHLRWVHLLLLSEPHDSSQLLEKQRSKFFGISADMKAVHSLGAYVLGVLSFVICATVKNNTIRYVFICFGGTGIWTATPIFLSWMVTMFDGREKREVSIALVNGFGNLASVDGSILWPSSDGPMYHIGFGVMTALLGAAASLKTVH
ncbi:hypothetical protein EHS25_007209 [Saitozyma podzolica]|uniref:Uncharacterized protein n=1 Tax=Saitozyma podzolica TaxID=1890683 RepID=A0A427XMQ2_9TREE|nr:hypothetical protein EHS25_007209 [Saitozyma podzolica]